MRYLFLLLLSLMGFWACQPEEACVSPATSQVILGFVRTEAGSVVAGGQVFSKIYSTTADTVFLDKGTQSITAVRVSLDPNLDSTVFIFERPLANSQVARDTLVLRYQRRYRLLSPDCPLEVNFSELAVAPAFTTFSRVDIVNSELRTRSNNEADVQVFAAP